MTVVAIWCRHNGDNLIGIDDLIPWQVPSDVDKFREVVKGQTIVCGRKTYETLPNRTIEGCKIFVLTSNADYEVSDVEKHFVISGQKELADIEEDIYVIGGAEIYKLFFTGKEKLKPQIVVDCVYDGEVDKLDGKPIAINEVIDVLAKKYFKISKDYCLDNVRSSLLVKKGDFVEQTVLKRLVMILEQKGSVDG